LKRCAKPRLNSGLSLYMESAFQLAARRAYRWATIVRDGEWGVIFHCYMGKKVCLCPAEDDAVRLAAGKCKAVPCNGNHTVERFEPVPLPQPVWVSIAERMG
jgi:hypothetical protein